ncbi:TPA: hypothetical protein N0F65_001137 [Lagenidium giganteum]|uniref:EF-hand domain-containing protein n=1 Tax=Lagenidium giganteum TaxID=4803 RepID=A0AAV2YYT3_9STRA|nr:TPA: hypothetical protein N0F65_001137 [Lagenidium giganteum]
MIETKSVEDLCIRLQLTKADVWKLRKQFNDQDVDHSGLITQAEFFHLVRETRRPLTKLIFRLAHVPAAKTRITFDEYVSCACQFAALSDTELLRFLFDSYNASSGGAGLTEKDIGKLAQDFQSMDASYANNITVATQRMVQSRDQMARDGVLPFEDFERMVRANKLAFMPFLQLQRNVRQGTLGEAFWVEKLRCQVILDRLLLFMRKHHGQLPPLPWRDSLARFFLTRETANTKLFALARTMYDSVGTT